VKDQLDSLIDLMIENEILFEDAVGEFERRFLAKIVEKNHGNLSKASKVLGIHRNTLSRKMANSAFDHQPKRRKRSKR
jgi:Fis family transcriptional regulator, factor for inversion stimulation protein